MPSRTHAPVSAGADRDAGDDCETEFGYAQTMLGADRHGHIVWLLLAALVFAFPGRAAERRVALVVGASAYRAVPPLRNTINDANGTAAALKRLQFDVDTVLDPDRGAFESAVRRFGERARTAD